MKGCGYCGRENPDDAAQCCECGTAFGAKTEAEQPAVLLNSLDQPISSRLKWGLWYAAWGVVVLVMNPVNILAAPLFPLGLLALFPRGEDSAIVLTMFGWLPGLIGWIIYVLLSVGISRTSKKGAFFLMYIVFCIVLALNVAGCKKTLQAVQEIH